jgi:hypothetical protein
MRAIVNAVQYRNRAGCAGSLLPDDLPHPWTVKYFFYRWRDDGLDKAICELLRCRVRERAGRAEDPGLVALDAKLVYAANNVPAATTGEDAGNRVAAVLGGLDRHDAQARRRCGPELARSMTEQAHALAAILVHLDTREQQIEAQAAVVRERLAQLTSRLGELGQRLEHVGITRKTLAELPELPEPSPAPLTQDPPSTPPTSGSSPS